MPKIVVYVRAEDARTIEAVDNMDIDLWVREQLKRVIETWHGQRAKKLGASKPAEWPTPQELKEG